MAYIEIEMKDGTLKLEYNREAIIKMEEMGYNAVNPTSKIMTNYEIIVFGGLLKHQPKTTWTEALEIANYLTKEYGLTEVLSQLAPMVNDVFHMEGKGKKLVVKGTKA